MHSKSFRSRARLPSCLLAFIRIFGYALPAALAMLSSLPAHAEKCWMAGCVGDIGYVYVPESQIYIGSGTTTLNVNARKYKLDPSGKLLREDGLPPVGAIVNLNVDATLLPYDSIHTLPVSQEIAKWPYALNTDLGIATLYVYTFDPTSGEQMRAGSRLQIIGYEGDRDAGHSRLFAIVSVQNN